MFLKHLINPKPTIILFFVVFCVVFISIPLINYDFNTIFINSNTPSYLVFFLGLTLPFFQGLGLNNLVYEKNIIRKDNLVIGFVFILLGSSFYNTVDAWISSFIMLFFFNFIMDSYQKDYPFSEYFNAALLLSLISIYYPNTIYFAFLFMISGVNFSNNNWRVIFTILLGLITPYIFYFVFAYVSGSSFNIPDFSAFNLFDFSNLTIDYSPLNIWVGTLFLISLVSIIELFRWLYKKSIRSRKSFLTIFWYFVISLLIAIYSGGDYFYFALTPLAVIIGNYFVYSKSRKIANILFVILVISSFYYKHLIAYNV